MPKTPLTGASPVSALEGYGRDGRRAQNGHPQKSRTPQNSSVQTGPPTSTPDKIELSREARIISQMTSSDRAVRDHEAAHQAAGGHYAGSARFGYRQGPDGKRYAVSGEVTIDASPVAGDPEATMKKAETVRAAALAPVDPSAQDQQVASQATSMKIQAQAELKTQGAEQAAEARNQESSTTAAKQQQTSAPDRKLDLYA